MFHSYWNIFGFEDFEFDEDNELYKLVKLTINEPTSEHTVYIDDKEYREFSRELCDGVGLTVFGYYSKSIDGEDFIIEHCYPYADSLSDCNITCSELTIEQMSDKFAYLGMVDCIDMNMVLIFYAKSNKFIRIAASDLNISLEQSTVGLSALSLNGTVLLPMAKYNGVAEKNKRFRQDRRISLLERARRGDEDAIESLTIDEMETQQMLMARCMREDLLTIVETYFMPDGLENDKYSILGDIISVEELDCEIVNQSFYRMVVHTNDVNVTLIVNKKDLVGEPEIGRRFRGKVWLLGDIKDIIN